MKNIIKLLLLIILYATVISQVNFNTIREKISLKGPVQLSDSVQSNLIIEQLLQLYGTSLEYYYELKSGSYIVTLKNSNEYKIEINCSDGKKIKLNIKKNSSQLNGYTYHIEYSSIEEIFKKNIKTFNFQKSPLDIIERNNMLTDMEILPYENLQPEDRRILDKEITTENFTNQNGEPLELFKMCQAGIIIPYSEGHSKLVTVDDGWSSLVYFDEGIGDGEDNPINKVYGYFGDDEGEFMYPAGITAGRKRIFGTNDIYPLYISDKIGLRIVRVDFIADNTFNQLGVIDENSFKRVSIITYPYDLAYYSCTTDSTNDKLWVTQQHPTQNFLTCLSIDGTEMQKFSGYKNIDIGQIYAFDSGTLSRIAVYNDGFGCLIFIDHSRNCLVSCLLNSDGTGNLLNIDSRNDYIIANEVIEFPAEYLINSVQFQKTPSGNNLWPSIWVTSPSYIHHLKVNTNGNVQYLASSKLPKNSIEYFSNLRNSITFNGIYDIYTIENWSMSRGLRKYYPFCDIHSEVLENYCNDSLNLMKFKATFTNDCWIYITAKRKNISGQWENVKIKELNGTIVNEYHLIKWQSAGWNQGSEDMYINLKLDLPIEDYLFGDSVKISISMYPEYSNPIFYFNNEHINKDYVAYIEKSCLPKPGGCPYLYVKNDTISFEPDNNILHKSEFTENQGNDITDLYKLSIPPFINNNIIELALVENEQDHSYFNQVKLYAVDHETSKKLGITEDNQLVLYDTTGIISPNYAALNGNDVTHSLQYNTVNTNPVKSATGDSLHADYLSGRQQIKTNSNYEQTMLPKAKGDNDNEIKQEKESKKAREIRKLRVSTNDGESYGLLTDSYNWDTLNPIQSKTWAGKIVSSYTSSYRDTVKFAIREKSSTDVIPVFYNIIFPDTLNYIDIELYRDMKNKYWCLMPLYYQGINTQEVRFVGATKLTRTNSVDIYSDLSDLDLLYAELEDTSLIKLQFDISNNPPQSGKTRDFVFEVNGRYIPGGSKDKIMSGIINQVLSKMYLYHNYPNPFNPETELSFYIKENGKVMIEIFDVKGLSIYKLFLPNISEGFHSIKFNSNNLCTGLYFYRIIFKNTSITKKMTIIK